MGCQFSAATWRHYFNQIRAVRASWAGSDIDAGKERRLLYRSSGQIPILTLILVTLHLRFWEIAGRHCNFASSAWTMLTTSSRRAFTSGERSIPNDNFTGCTPMSTT